jgi:hypothetical protein
VKAVFVKPSMRKSNFAGGVEEHEVRDAVVWKFLANFLAGSFRSLRWSVPERTWRYERISPRKQNSSYGTGLASSWVQSELWEQIEPK